MWLSAPFILGFVMVMQASQAVAQQAQQPAAPPQWYGPGPWFMWGDGYGWQFWWICPLMMLFMIVVFAAIFLLVRRSSTEGAHHWGPPWRASGHAALQILNERFARGEIQRDEYEDKRTAILSGGHR
jgi:putative membrane protein